MKKVLLDAHTHTVASGHAYSSLQEMAKAAADKGLEVLGITEHGPSVPGTCPTLYFKNMFVVPRRMYGVRLLMGCEILRLCKKYEVPTILGSDAHISFQIADYERLYPLLAETDFPDELIMRSNSVRFA